MSSLAVQPLSRQPALANKTLLKIIQRGHRTLDGISW